MKFSDLIRTRHPLGNPGDRAIEPEKLDKILQAGRLAPTTRFSQTQRILVVDSPEAIEKLKSCTPCHYDAITFLVLCYDHEISQRNNNPFGHEEFGAVDAGIVGTYMMLQATELGIDLTWVNCFNTERLRTEFNIPEHYEVVSLMPLGYSTGGKTSNAQDGLLPMEETVSFNRFHVAEMLEEAFVF